MSWNPFRRRDEAEPSPGSAAQAHLHASAGDDDPTDPLISTAAYVEQSQILRSWPTVSLEQIRIGDSKSPSDSFLKLLLREEGPLSRGLPDMLTRGGALFGLRDLLADGNCVLAASLEAAELSLQELNEQHSNGQVLIRPLDVLLALRDLAGGLELAREHGLGWLPAADALAFARSGMERPGLCRWQLRFLGFGDLQETLATDASELVTLLRPLLDCVYSSESAGLLPRQSHLRQLPELFERLQNDSTLDLAGLRDEIDNVLNRMTIRGTALTDTGMKRQHNEDAWCIADVMQQSAIGSHFLLAAVADGMGGHESGEIASSLALAMLRQQLQSALTAPSTRGIDPLGLATQLQSVIPAINRALCDRSAMDPALSGMGTTLCGFALVSSSSTMQNARQAFAAVFNVGDSRCYLVGPQQLWRLSSDHSFVQGLVDSGEITTEQAFDHPRKNVITRCLGGNGQDAEPDVFPFRPGPCERLLICSDGLTDALRDGEIREVLVRTAEDAPGQVAKALVDAANAAGGPDNITVLLLDCRL
jgi:protein phosphatase